jgi:hypothetical protein
MVAATTSRVRAFRQRQKQGHILLPRIEIDMTVADALVEAGHLGEWDTENPSAIAEAVKRLLRQIGNDVS